jgi:hypothetical protein
MGENSAILNPKHRGGKIDANLEKLRYIGEKQDINE